MRYGDEWILGNSLLRTYYMVYDMDDLTISFAPAVNPALFSGSERMAVTGFLAL
jgi:hypothetical protein